MANVKSAKKRIRVIEKKTLRNRMVKSQVKTEIRKVMTELQNGNAEAAKANLQSAISAIDKARAKGVYHKNNAARKISRLTKAVNKASV